MFGNLWHTLRRYYDLLVSGLNRAEIERLVKVDARDMYAYYVRSMRRPAAEEQRWKRLLLFCENLFLTFLLKLTPARRLLYAVALLLFTLAWLHRQWTYAIYTFVILNFLLALELADKLIEKDELAVAREIQLSLLPDASTPVPGFGVATFSDAARSVGGDYYDFVPQPDGSTLAVIGDVSGKGIAAALYMVKVQTLLQLLARECIDPCELLVRLNSHLYPELRRDHFLTMALLKLFPDGRIQFCRAGHAPALLCDGRKARCFWLEPKGAAIGLVPPNGSVEDAAHARRVRGGQRHLPQFEQMLEVEERLLKPDDLLLLFTDGVVETFNGHRQEFGEDRLKKLLLRHRHDTPAQVKSAILEELASFRAGGELWDDITFVVLKRLPQRVTQTHITKEVLEAHGKHR